MHASNFMEFVEFISAVYFYLLNKTCIYKVPHDKLESYLVDLCLSPWEEEMTV